MTIKSGCTVNIQIDCEEGTSKRASDSKETKFYCHRVTR